MIKNTRWSFIVSVAQSQATVHTPWPRPLTPHLHTFKAHAERYRRRKRIALSLMIGFVLVGVLMMNINLPNEAAIWGGVLMAASWLFALLIFVFGLRLRCSACKKRLEPARGLYCPMCGSDRFEHGRHKIGPLFARYPYCPSCDHKIADPSGDDSRSYTIRGCTHCGVMLDETGL
jgi:DNA-directed RNA polymerase subunit RPC12/RpoP